jgi:hypothetical protein
MPLWFFKDNLTFFLYCRPEYDPIQFGKQATFHMIQLLPLQGILNRQNFCISFTLNLVAI